MKKKSKSFWKLPTKVYGLSLQTGEERFVFGTFVKGAWHWKFTLNGVETILNLSQESMAAMVNIYYRSPNHELLSKAAKEAKR